jgi:transposase
MLVKKEKKARNISKMLGNTTRSVHNILKQYREIKSIKLKPFLVMASIFTEEHLKSIRAELESHPDSTLIELIEKLHLPIKKSRLSEVLIDLIGNYSLYFQLKIIGCQS